MPHSMHVLVVDDVADVANLMGILVRRKGCTCDVALSGQQALQLAHNTRPDLALLDVSMPEMDGYELARRLRNELQLDSTHLVAVTGHPIDIDSLHEAGFGRAFQKPLDFSKVESLLNC